MSEHIERNKASKEGETVGLENENTLIAFLMHSLFLKAPPPTPRGGVRQTTGVQWKILGGKVQAAPLPRCQPAH